MTVKPAADQGNAGLAGLRRAALEAAGPLVGAALAEDVGDGDRTGLWTVPAESVGRAHIVAKAEGVMCGLEVAERVFRTVDAGLAVTLRAGDAAVVEKGDIVLDLSGSLRGILAAERTALNFLSRLSGISTLTSAYVRAVAGTGCRIADTRKTTPGWRQLEKYAARCGGAMSHRSGLYDMVLIKENHIRAAGGVGPALEAALPAAREEGLEVEIEVTSRVELREALAHGPDRIMLDNMSPAELEAAVHLVRSRPPPHPLLEASGGVTVDTARRVAETGVDYVSVGAITHSAPALDLSLLVTDE